MQKFQLFFLILASLSVFGQENHFDHCKDLSEIIEMEQQAHAQLLDFRSNELTQNYDLKYHRLEWEVDPAINYIKGIITSYFIPTDLNFQQINFDLANNMTVNAVLFHGDSLEFSQLIDDNLQINFKEILANGQLDSLSVHYEGAPNSTGFGSFEQSYHNGAPVLWTLSEPYGAKVWWPCKQDLTDKIDSTDIIVKTLKGNRVGSNGKLIGEHEDGDYVTYTWKHRYPIPAYLIAIAVSNYAAFSDYVKLENGDSIEILNYVFPENLASAKSQLYSSVEIMELFNDLFGIYPFAKEKYGHAQFGWGGGMEHQTMSFMINYSYGLQAHELAHQWFGDKITCGSWEDIWLNEGFATYLTALTSEFLGNEAEWDAWKSWRIDRIVSQPGGSVRVDDTTRVGRIFDGRLSYSKGALLLHMLRWKLGDLDFFQAMKNYAGDPKLAYSYAKTRDFQAHLEQQNGQDLEEFFRDWFYGEGFPSYHITWMNLEDKFKLKIEQTTSHTSVGFYEMPIPVYVFGEGRDSILRLDHLFSGQVFKIELPFMVDSVSFDPDLWIVSTGNTVEEMLVSSLNEELLQKVSISPNPVSDWFEIHIAGELDFDRIEILNVNGRIVDQIEIYDEKVRLDATKWAPGNYWILFIKGKETATLPIIKI